MLTLRWIAFLPLAIIASLSSGALTAVVGEVFAGGPNWYTWLISGVATGGVFCYVAFKVAPAPTSLVKWSTVGFISVVGVIALIRPIIDGNILRGLQGVGMLVMAVTYARQSPRSLRANPEGVVDSSSAPAA